MYAADKPRERIITYGSHRVCTGELLAVVLGTGVRGRSAVQLAEHVLGEVGGVTQLSRASPHELMNMKGIGLARATRISAAFQLGRRAIEESLPVLGVACSPEQVFQRLQPRLHGLMQEVFVVLALDARSVIIDEFEVARGCLTHVEVHPREVFRPLIRCAAAAAVIAHNHPSGDPTPSMEDISLTHRLRAVGEIIGVPIVDHLVIGDGAYVSVAAQLQLG